MSKYHNFLFRLKYSSMVFIFRLKKLRVAFVYKKDASYLTGKHFVNTIYHFWMNALKRNSRMEITYCPTDDIFDATKLKNKIDAVLLYQNHDLNMPKEITGIKELGVPIISGLIDPHHEIDRRYFHEKYNIDCYISIIPEKYFHRFYPSDFMYKQLFWGLEPSLYSQITPFNNRIENKILNSGAIGNPKTISKIINYIRKPHSNSYNQYKLRTKCNQLSYVDYTPTLQHEYINDKYPLSCVETINF